MTVKILSWDDIVKAGSLYQPDSKLTGIVYPPMGYGAQFIECYKGICGTEQVILGQNIFGSFNLKDSNQVIEEWMIEKEKVK